MANRTDYRYGGGNRYRVEPGAECASDFRKTVKEDVEVKA